MAKVKNIKYSEMLRSNNRQQQQLNDIVLRSLEEEKLIANKLNQVDTNNTFGQRAADAVARFGGSWSFIILFAVIILVWIVLNSAVLMSHAFDVYPYILLNLVLSCLAALQAPVIMMSQNRQDEKDRRRAMDDYAVNLKAEVDLMTLHEKMDLLVGEQMKILLDSQAEQLAMIRDLQKNLIAKKAKDTDLSSGTHEGEKEGKSKKKDKQTEV